MASWTQPTAVRTLIDEIAGQQEAAYEATGTVLDGVVEGLEAAGEILQIVQALASPDPLSAIVGAAIQQFQDFVQNLLGADIYVLPMMPTSWRDLLRPYTIDMALNDLASSVGDMRDPSRPILGHGAAYASLTVMVGANNWEDFLSFIKIFGELFDGTEFNKWSRLFDLRFNFDHHIPLPRRDRNSQGTPWDWHRTDWMELIPPIREVMEQLFELADSLVGVSRGLTNAMSDLVDTLRERIEYIRQVLDVLARIADLIRRWKELVPRLHVLVVSGAEGGTSGYVDAVVNAGNRPEFKLCAGMTFLASGPNPMANLAVLERLIGLKVQEFEDAVDNAEAAIEDAEGDVQ